MNCFLCSLRILCEINDIRKMQLSPIKFKPIIKEKIWGGTKLRQLLNKKSKSNQFGESWEISSVKGNISIVESNEDKGKTLTALIQKYKGKLVGNKIYREFGTNFPLLIKFIDAKENLSIQLHPSDKLAQERHQCFGKTEMWYVMQANDNAELIVGFKEKVSEKEYVEYLNKNQLKEILNIEKGIKGDVYFIETGTVHAIGAGVLLAEIQQTSDVTYRIYDWNRKDKDGKERELHTENALKAIDFKVKNSYKTNYKTEKNKSNNVITCPFFTTNIIELEGNLILDHTEKDSFVIYMCVKGNVIFAFRNEIMQLNYGETLLIPNNLNEFEIISKEKTTLLEVFID